MNTNTINPITGMPLNIVNPPPVGAKSGSPMDIANANMKASTNQMSSLLGLNKGTKGGSHRHRRSLTKGGAAEQIAVQPLQVPYPGGSGLNDINTQLTRVGAAQMANSVGDNAWRQKGGYSRSNSRSNKRSNKRTNKRTNKRNRRTNKRNRRTSKK